MFSYEEIKQKRALSVDNTHCVNIESEKKKSAIHINTCGRIGVVFFLPSFSIVHHWPHTISHASLI